MIATVSDLITAIQSLPPSTPVKVDGVTIQRIVVDANGVAQVSIASSNVESD